MGLLLDGIFEMKKMILETRWLSLEHPHGNVKREPTMLISFWEFEFHHSFGFYRIIDGLGIVNF